MGSEWGSETVPEGYYEVLDALQAIHKDGAIATNNLIDEWRNLPKQKNRDWWSAHFCMNYWAKLNDSKNEQARQSLTQTVEALEKFIDSQDLRFFRPQSIRDYPESFLTIANRADRINSGRVRRVVRPGLSKLVGEKYKKKEEVLLKAIVEVD